MNTIYNATITIRLEQATKDRLWEEAERKGVPFSEHVRELLDKGMLPNDMCELLPHWAKDLIEERASKAGEEPGTEFLRMIPRVFQWARDNKMLF